MKFMTTNQVANIARFALTCLEEQLRWRAKSFKRNVVAFDEQSGEEQEEAWPPFLWSQLTLRAIRLTICITNNFPPFYPPPQSIQSRFPPGIVFQQFNPFLLPCLLNYGVKEWLPT